MLAYKERAMMLSSSHMSAIGPKHGKSANNKRLFLFPLKTMNTSEHRVTALKFNVGAQ